MKTTNTAFHWLPRVICILAILFVSMFAADAFVEGQTLLQNLTALFMHLIPSFVLIAFLAIAWRREFAGGILFTIVGLVMTPLVFILNHNRNHFSIGQSAGIVMMITFPFIVVGVLFIISHYLQKKQISKQPGI